MSEIAEYKQELLNKLDEKNYAECHKEEILRAFDFAAVCHSSQRRKSGEPYIVHPLNVALKLIEWRADVDTICAGLLHDTIEDTKVTEEEIIHEFNEIVAKLVNGVTKIGKEKIPEKEIRYLTNSRHLITSLMDDPRIAIIKLSDRLHNISTIEYHKPEKQIEIADETMSLYNPIANQIGLYDAQRYLEDKCLKILHPDDYKRFFEIQQTTYYNSKGLLAEMREQMTEELNSKGINNDISDHIKNVYGIYNNSKNGIPIENMHDLISLKVIVDTDPDCFLALCYINGLYTSTNYFRDYIHNPKNNLYRSLHTAIINNKKLVQIRIRTFLMEMIARYGIASCWTNFGHNIQDDMRMHLQDKGHLLSELEKINQEISDDRVFYKTATQELLSPNMVYVRTSDGVFISLPKGSNLLDFAKKIKPEAGMIIDKFFVNEKEEAPDYILRENDLVYIKFKDEIYTSDNVQTTGEKVKKLSPTKIS